MRCQQCGATNPDEARWCGQCYASFVVDEPAAEVAAGRQHAPAPPDGGTVGVAARDPGAQARSRPADQPRLEEAGEVSATGFRRRGEAVEWQCVTCAAFNELDHSSCSVCGTPLAARFAEAKEAPEPESWSAAIALSAVLPGTGHVLAGQSGSGVARGLLYVVWLTGGLLLLLTAGATAAPAAVPLLLGALVVWGGTLLDLVSLRTGGRQVLSGRTLLWLVVGVTVLLLLGAFSGAAGLG